MWGVAFTKKECFVGWNVVPREAESVMWLVTWMGRVIEGIGETIGPGDVGWASVLTGSGRDMRTTLDVVEGYKSCRIL